MPAINWDLPLETDEPTPREVKRQSATPFPGYWCSVTSQVGWTRTRFAYLLDGTPCPPAAPDAPKIRNVRPLRTSDEYLQRMEALVRRLGSSDGNEAYAVEARQIVKLLPVPAVDPLDAEVKALCDASDYDLHDLPIDRILDANEAIKRLVRAALVRGQELAAES